MEISMIDRLVAERDAAEAEAADLRRQLSAALGKIAADEIAFGKCAAEIEATHRQLAEAQNSVQASLAIRSAATAERDDLRRQLAENKAAHDRVAADLRRQVADMTTRYEAMRRASESASRRWGEALADAGALRRACAGAMEYLESHGGGMAIIASLAEVIEKTDPDRPDAFAFAGDDTPPHRPGKGTLR